MAILHTYDHTHSIPFNPWLGIVLFQEQGIGGVVVGMGIGKKITPCLAAVPSPNFLIRRRSMAAFPWKAQSIGLLLGVGGTRDSSMIEPEF